MDGAKAAPPLIPSTVQQVPHSSFSMVSPNCPRRAWLRFARPAGTRQLRWEFRRPTCTDPTATSTMETQNMADGDSGSPTRKLAGAVLQLHVKELSQRADPHKTLGSAWPVPPLGRDHGQRSAEMIKVEHQPQTRASWWHLTCSNKVLVPDKLRLVQQCKNRTPLASGGLSLPVTHSTIFCLQVSLLLPK